MARPFLLGYFSGGDRDQFFCAPKQQRVIFETVSRMIFKEPSCLKKIPIRSRGNEVLPKIAVKVALKSLDPQLNRFITNDLIPLGPKPFARGYGFAPEPVNCS